MLVLCLNALPAAALSEKLLDEALVIWRHYSVHLKAFIVKQHEQELNTTPETAEEEEDEQYVLARHKVAVKARLVLVMSETRPR